MKRILQEAIEKKNEVENKKMRKKEEKEQKKKIKSNKIKNKNKRKINISLDSPSKSDNEENNLACFYCDGKYMESNEGWAACSLCGKWAHCSCAGIDDEDDEATFYCEFCIQK